MKKLILWDLDGTLCPHNKQFHYDAPIAVANAVIDMGVNISFNEAVKFAQNNYPGQRTAVRAFSKKFGLNEDELFQTYYKHLKDDFLYLNNGLIKKLQNNINKYEYGVLTNASSFWIKKALSKLEIYNLFNKNFLFGYELLGQRFKTNNDAFNDIISTCRNSGYQSENIIIIDDKLKFLKNINNKDVKKIWLTDNIKEQVDNISCVVNSPIDVFLDC